MKQFQITPDWSKHWTAKEAEEQLTGFTFQGIGWYNEGGDSMLVIESSMKDEQQRYNFMVFNGNNPIRSFGYAISLPEHK